RIESSSGFLYGAPMVRPRGGDVPQWTTAVGLSINLRLQQAFVPALPCDAPSDEEIHHGSSFRGAPALHVPPRRRRIGRRRREDLAFHAPRVAPDAIDAAQIKWLSDVSHDV